MLPILRSDNAYFRRFLSKVKITDSCWLWIASKDSKGYGGFRFLGKMNKAHRISWLLFKGSIPNKMLICHKCDTPACVRPSHLFLGTYMDNSTDCVNKGRTLHRYGADNPNAKLKNSEIKEIIRLYSTGNTTLMELGKLYGVTHQAIGLITKRHEKEDLKYLE